MYVEVKEVESTIQYYKILARISEHIIEAILPNKSQESNKETEIHAIISLN